MTTDILIPLNNGSKHEDIEIRYCLRSIERHLKGVGNVIIVGEKPEWLQNITHIPATDNTAGCMRAENIYRKIIKGLEYASDDFLFMNDDHFLLSDFQAGEFPYLHRGQILTYRIGNEGQTRQMENTVAALKWITSEPFDFDLHCPIVYNKEMFLNTLPSGDWPEYGYGIKSLYGNSAILKSSFCEDLKISEPAMKETIYRVLEGRQWFSIGDKCLRSGSMKEVLQELYPDKSKYEL